MENGEMAQYGNGPFRIKRNRGWFQRTEEYWMLPSERLTLIPIVRAKRFERLRWAWRAIAPAYWSKFWTRRSHLKFLRDNGAADIEKSLFGTPQHLESIKGRLDALPPLYSNGFDARCRSRGERSVALRAQLKSACEAQKDTDTVVHLKPTNGTTP